MQKIIGNSAAACFTLKKSGFPHLLVSARDDPFLSLECFPYKIANRHEYFFSKRQNTAVM
ncbi:MAG: hypothetical protein R3C26_22875 [Calditrichia bacterium]